MLVLHRRDQARRMHRFYAVRLQAELLGGWAVVREWGRAGQGGQVRADRHDCLASAQLAAERLARRKRRRGYRG